MIPKLFELRLSLLGSKVRSIFGFFFTEIIYLFNISDHVYDQLKHILSLNIYSLSSQGSLYKGLWIL